MRFRRAINPADPTIRVTVRCALQMFSSIDPSAFHERDIDPDAEHFIVDWGREVSKDAPLKLEVAVTEPDNGYGGPQIAEAVHQHFRRRADATSSELRQLFRRGRVSAVIGISCLAASVVVSDLVANALGNTNTGHIVQEGLQLLGWVSTWKPIETYLYSWWPILGDRRLYDRLAQMPVEVVGPSVIQA